MSGINGGLSAGRGVEVTGGWGPPFETADGVAELAK